MQCVSVLEPFVPHICLVPYGFHQLLHSFAELVIMCTELENGDNVILKLSFLFHEDTEQIMVEEGFRILQKHATDFLIQVEESAERVVNSLHKSAILLLITMPIPLFDHRIRDKLLVVSFKGASQDVPNAIDVPNVEVEVKPLALGILPASAFYPVIEAFEDLRVFNPVQLLKSRHISDVIDELGH